MGTRYSKGDRVKDDTFVYEVTQVLNPESDSPDYRLVPVEGDGYKQPTTKKASEIRKADTYSKEEIMNAFGEAKQQIANRHAAVFQSNLTGVDERVDLFVAEYGDKIGVNGEEMNDSYSVPDDYTLLEDREFSYEEEVDGEVLELTYIILDADFSNDRIEDVIEDEVGMLSMETFAVDVEGRHRLYTKD